MAQGVTRLRVPAGTYRVSSQFIITSPIKFIGDGNGFIANAGFPATVGTTFKWSGGATAVFTFQDINFAGFGMIGISIDCNSVATNGLIVEDSVGGHFDAVGIRNYAIRGLWLNSTNTYPGNTNSWHRFDGLSLDSSIAGAQEAIRLSGFASMGNACHNTFTNTRISHGGTAHGIVLGGCDNNAFVMTYIYRQPGGTGNGVYCDTTEQANFPEGNVFVHLQAGTGGWYQPASTTTTPAKIYAYQRDNGEPKPILSTNGSTLVDCADVVFPVTLAAGSGWSGGAPTFLGYYRKSGSLVTVTMSILGTAFVAAANASITGLPNNSGNTYGLGMAMGYNTGGSGAQISGYISGSTLTLPTGISSSNSASLVCQYLTD